MAWFLNNEPIFHTLNKPPLLVEYKIIYCVYKII